MRTGGGQSDDRVTRLDPAAINDGALLNDADTKTRQVVVFTRINPRHLRSLAADQRGTCLDAAFGDSTDHGLGDIDAQFPGRVVVQEEQGLGALNDNVVNAHRDEVNSDGVVATGVYGESKFRAVSVDT